MLVPVIVIIDRQGVLGKGVVTVKEFSGGGNT